MDFVDRLHELATQLPKLAQHIEGNEEATKNALIMPFIGALGYNVFNPTEVVPEFTADVGTKKGEKVDYAILREGVPAILFECKSYGSDLSRVHASQLYRYFSVTEARFGILTNGVEYRFYSDLEAPNKMDEKPFLIFDLRRFPESIVDELKKFAKSSFDVENILSTASELKYTREIKRIINNQLTEPDEDFIRYFATKVYSGRITQSVKDQFSEMITKALKQFINERVNDRLKSALDGVGDLPVDTEEPTEHEENEEEPIVEVPQTRKIVTTQEELDGYFVVKSILREVIKASRIAIRDTKSYCGILLDDNNRQPICRLHFNRTQKYIGLFGTDRKEVRHPIESVDDIYQYAEQLIQTLGLYESLEVE